MAQIKVPQVTFNNGLTMPLFGLGTSHSTNESEMTNLIRSALDIGYRHIDTAIVYGNEKIIGDALANIFSEGKYKREDLFIVSKIFSYADLNPVDAVKKSLLDLRINHLDLLLLHWPFAPNRGPESNVMNHRPVHKQWALLEEVHEQGLTRSLGVSNFNVQSLVDLLSYAKVKPVANQIELHVFLQQRELVQFSKNFGIHSTAYCPLARFTDIVNNETLKAIAAKHGVPISQVLLQFLLAEGISVIPKTEKIARLRENLESVSLQLTQEDIETLRGLDQGHRTNNPGEWQRFHHIPIFN